MSMQEHTWAKNRLDLDDILAHCGGLGVGLGVGLGGGASRVFSGGVMLGGSCSGGFNYLLAVLASMFHFRTFSKEL